LTLISQGQKEEASVEIEEDMVVEEVEEEASADQEEASVEIEADLETGNQDSMIRRMILTVKEMKATHNFLIKSN
jgi:hypothetical protein